MGLGLKSTPRAQALMVATNQRCTKQAIPRPSFPVFHTTTETEKETPVSYPRNFPHCYKPWLSGRIGAVEHSVCRALIGAKYPLTTGDMVREVYLSPYGRKGCWRDPTAPPPKPKRWMYGRIRKACETYAIRLGRGEGQGRPVLWRLKDDVSIWSIRKEKTARDAKRRRRLARLRKNNIKEVR